MRADQSVSLEASWEDLSTSQVNHILRLQRDVLTNVARKLDSESVLVQLCKTLEALVPDALASVMLIDRDSEVLSVVAAPSIPASAVERLNGLKPGPQGGSCASALFHRAPQYVENTLIDARWGKLRQFALDFDIRACWSHPFTSEDDAVSGTVALSSYSERRPDSFQRQLLETGAQLALIVLERDQEEKRLWRLAHHDQLTGLPNRTLLNHSLTLAIADCRRHQHKLALLFVDLDNFKDINDTFGHHEGDLVLKQVAHRMADCLRGGDLLARQGGDEFVVLLSNIDESTEASSVAEKLLSLFRVPIRIGERDHHLSTSIGISIFPDDGPDLETLQKHADVAMYEAKAKGRGGFQYFEQDLSQAVAARVQIANALRGTLARNEIVPWFQPQLNAVSGKLESVEVLAHWAHAEIGVVAPDVFIAVAENAGLIATLGFQLARAACSQCVTWWQDGIPPFRLALNISARQLCRGFAGELLALLDSLDFPRDALELEVTESLIMERGEELVTELENLNEAGVTISLDDFGTGRSSLAQLKRLPIDKLKIDRSFIMDIPRDENDVVIAETVIAMGHCLNLKIVAEGVETEEQVSILRDRDCDLLQGFHFCRPLPADQFEQYLRNKG